MPKTAALLALVCLMFVLAVHGASASTDITACPAVPTAGPISAAVLSPGVSATSCGLVGRLVRHNRVGARIQQPGEGVFAEALGDKQTSTLHLVTAIDGGLSVDFETVTAPKGHTHPGANRAKTTRRTQAHTADNGCSDGFLPSISHHESNFHRWRYNEANTPTNLTINGANAAITAGSRISKRITTTAALLIRTATIKTTTARPPSPRASPSRETARPVM